MTQLRASLRQTLLLATALLCLAVAAQSQTQPRAARNIRITLLQLNDVYQISPLDKDKSAGLARVATLRKKIMAESPNTIFLPAGDTISPSVASTVFKGERVNAPADLNRLVDRTGKDEKESSETTLTIVRGRSEQTIKVRFGRR